MEQKTEFDKVLLLSPREHEVFELLGCGGTTREVATKLCVSGKTIETHVNHIKTKLELPNICKLRELATRYTVFTESTKMRRVPRDPVQMAPFKFEKAVA
jgi:DNA-binding NarL/FixJ family response regulator